MLAGVLFGIASISRLWLALVRPLWHDEIFTVWVSRMSTGGIVDALRTDSGPPLFYLLARPFLHLADLWHLPDAVARFLPFLAITCLAFGARSLPDKTARATFLALIATFALLGFYSAEARAYALLAALDFALFLELRQRRDDLVHAVLVALLAAAALLTHYLAVFFVGAAGLLMIFERRWRKLAALAAGSILVLPWLPILLRQPSDATAWLRESLPGSVAGFLAALGGVGRIPPAFGAPVPAALAWLAAATGAVLLGALVPAARREPEIRAGLAAVGITLVAVLCAGIVRPVAFAGRSEMAVLPVWIWSIALAARTNRVVRAAAVFAGVLGALAFGLAAPAMATRPEPSASRVAAALERSAAPADVVIGGTTFYLPLRLARDRGTLRARVIGFPEDVERHPGWFRAEAPPPDAYRRLEDELARMPAGARAWIAVHPLFLTPEMRRTLEAAGSTRVALNVPDAAVILWTRGPGS